MSEHKGTVRGLHGLGLAAVLAIGGCSTTGTNIDSAAELDAAMTSTSDTVVFGQLHLVRNGHAVQLGEGLRDNPATLRLYRPGDGREFIRHVGADGEFAWVLPAGNYRMTNVGFRHHGDTIEPLTDFSFTATTTKAASFVGELTLEVTVDAGYLGTVGTLDSYDVQGDCADACERMAERLGLDTADVTTSTLRWEGQVARTN